MCQWWQIECRVDGCNNGLACDPQIKQPCASRCGRTNSPYPVRGWCETHKYANARVGDLIRSGLVTEIRPVISPRGHTDDSDQLRLSSQQQLSRGRTTLPSISTIAGNTAAGSGQGALNPSFGPGAATMQKSSGFGLPSFSERFGDIPKPGSALKQASAANYPTSSGNRTPLPAGGGAGGGGYQQQISSQPPSSVQYSYRSLAPKDCAQQSQSEYSSGAQSSQASRPSRGPQTPPLPVSLDKTLLLPLRRDPGDEMRLNAWPPDFQFGGSNPPLPHPLAPQLESRGWYEPPIFQYLHSNAIEQSTVWPSRSAFYAWAWNDVDLRLWWLPLPFETFEEFEYRQRNIVRRGPSQLRDEVLWQQFIYREANDPSLAARTPGGTDDGNGKPKGKKPERGDGGGASRGGSGKGGSSYPGSQYGAAGPARSW